MKSLPTYQPGDTAEDQLEPLTFSPRPFQKEIFERLKEVKVPEIPFPPRPRVIGIDLAKKGGDKNVAVYATKVGDRIFLVNGIDEISYFPDYKWYRNPIKWWKWRRMLKIIDAQIAKGKKDGKPAAKYEPWHYGSPWTKQTALWGDFNMPEKVFDKWEHVPENAWLYIRPGRQKPSLAFMHKSAYDIIEEFQHLPRPTSDMEFRSLCSQNFAYKFKEANP